MKTRVSKHTWFYVLELINWLCEGFLSSFSQMRSKLDEFLCLFSVPNKCLVKGLGYNIEYKFDVLQENVQLSFVLFNDNTCRVNFFRIFFSIFWGWGTVEKTVPH